jgi:hypothetical protein
MLVRVNDPDRLVELLMFLRNSGFPLVQRHDEATAKLHAHDEARVREAIALWETTSGVHAEIVS